MRGKSVCALPPRLACVAADAMPTTVVRRARGGSARGNGSSCCRRTPWASCSTSSRSPTTSLQWRRRAPAPRRCRLAQKLRPFSGEVATLRGHENIVRSVTASDDGQIVTGSVRPHRQGVARRRVRAHHRGARHGRQRGGGAAGRGLLVSGCTMATWKSCGRSTARSSATFAVFTTACSASSRCPTACTLRSAQLQRGPAVPRRRDARPHLQKHRHGDGGGGDTRWPAYISGAIDKLVMVWSVATKTLASTCGEEYNEDTSTGHTNEVCAVAAMPDGQRILSGGDDETVRVRVLDGTLENITFSCTPTWQPPSWRCPTTSTRSPARGTTPSSSSTSTTAAPSCAPSSTIAPRGAVPDAAARRPPLRQRLGRDRSAVRIVEHGLAPQ